MKRKEEIKSTPRIERGLLPGQEYLVSSIVSTYNNKQYIRGCLDDLERQTIAGRMEIIFIDSGSQEGEGEIVKYFQERNHNILYLRTKPENLFQAWNRGIGMARGKYVTTANTDDAHRPDALEIMVAALETNPQADLAYSDYAWTSRANDSTSSASVIRQVLFPPYHPAQALIYSMLGCHPVWRKSVFEKLGLFDPYYQVAGDYDFFLRFVKEGLQPVHVPQILSFFFQNPTGLSKTNPRTATEYRRIFNKFRTGIPIDKLFRVDPKNPIEMSKAWVTQGGIAAQCRVPWLDEPVGDLGYAMNCYQDALDLDGENVAAIKNQMTLLAMRDEWMWVDLVGRLLPEDEKNEWIDSLKRSQFTLQNISTSSSLNNLEYQHHQSGEAVGIRKNIGISPHEAEKKSDWRVDIVIPVYGQGALLQKCVESVLLTTDPDIRLFVVDDCSPGDEIQNCFSQWLDDSRVVLLKTTINSGFIGTCKLGASIGDAPYILFLNSDTEAIEKGWLDRMLPVEDNIAIVGARLLYPPDFGELLGGHIQHAGVARTSESAYHPFIGFPADYPPANEERDVNAVTGACFLVRRHVWDELGGWDNRFGKGVFEDVDFCWQARKRGYRVFYQPKAVLYHKQSASTETGYHSLHDSSSQNLEALLKKWPGTSSDEVIFYGEETQARWMAAREIVIRAKRLLTPKTVNKAAQLMVEASEMAPDLPEVQIACAKIFATMGDHAAAVSFYQKASICGPGEMLIRIRMVEELLILNRYEEAEEEVSRLMEVFPNSMDLKRATVLIRRKQQADSLSPIPDNPEMIEAKNTLDLLFREGDLLAALRKYENRLDRSLLSLLRVNIQDAYADNQPELGKGLEKLAVYIEQILKKRELE